MPFPVYRPTRLLWLPKLALVLLVASILSLLWILHWDEREEQRNTLISDVLWLEQNLRFQLNNTAEQLSQLGEDLGRTPSPASHEMFRIRAAHHVKTINELTQIVHLDVAGKPLQHIPSSLAPLPNTATLTTLLGVTQKLQHAQFAEPYFRSDAKARTVIAVHAGLVQGKPSFLIGVIDLDKLLQDAVPWWFTQKYQVRLINDSGTELARKSNLDIHQEDDPNLSYELTLDPLGDSVRLAVTAYKTEGNTSQRALSIAIILLAAGVLASLWIVRNQMRKRQTTEEALRAEYAFRESMENSLNAGMRARDLEGRMIYVNPAFCRMTGFSRDELIGRLPPMPYWPPEHMEETYNLHRAVLSGDAPEDGFEVELRRKNGEPLHALIYEAPLIDGKGQHVGWMGSVLDVTQRHKAEELARQQAEKLQSTARLVTLGEMASTLAHELNQPLAAITSYNSGSLNILNSDLPIDERVRQQIRQALEKLGAQAQRAGKIIRRVHEFVKKREPKRAPCSLQEIIEDSIGFSEAEARNFGATLETQVPADLPLIDADRLMIEQVLLNLIRNGLEAMRQTPTVSRRVVVSVNAEPEQATVRVRDYGTGIPENVQHSLFTAFFTTKAEGLGIGLSICRSIVEFHQGRLWLETPDNGCGAIFAFTLPWAVAQSEENGTS